MTYKHAILNDKTWAHSGNFGFSPAGLIAKLRKAVKLEIPTGYQDETGFHYGVKAADKQPKWPSVS